MKNRVLIAAGATAMACLASAAQAHSGGGGGGVHVSVHGGGAHGGGVHVGAHGGGHSGHSGVHVTYTYVYVGGVRRVVAVGADSTDSAAVFDMTDQALEAASGVMKPGDVIARHTLRVTDAIVLDATAAGTRGPVRAGTVLVRVESSAPTPVYCDVRARGEDNIPCFQIMSDGKLRVLWSGSSYNHFAPFEDNEVALVGPIAPTAYHTLAPDQRPTAQIGFRWCDGDGVSTPPRFAAVVSEFNGKGWAVQSTCDYGGWAKDGDTTHAEFAGLHMDISPAAGGALTYKVTDRVAVGQLAMLQVGDAVMTVDQAAAKAAAQKPAPVVADTKPKSP